MEQTLHSGSATQIRGRHLHVLIVDRNESDARLCQEGFDAWGPVTCYHCPDCDDARRFLHREDKYTDAFTPDFVLLAIHLPKQSGLEFLKEIRGNPAFHTIPIIMFTISANPSDVAEAYRLGANAFLHKPSDLDRFIEVVQSCAEFWSNTLRAVSNG